jgi:predicted phosphodiesterase
MRRTIKTKIPTAILTSDWHLREDTPTCRTDDFWEAQWNKVRAIRELQKKFDCLVLCAGDLFHHWKTSPYLLATTINNLPKRFFSVLGNHDLPQHSIDLKEKCGVNVLEAAKKLTILSECNWGQMPDEGSLFFPNTGTRILIWHIMTYKGNAPWPECTDKTALGLLKEYSEFPLLLTGDNHTTFVEEYEGRLLVNPGSLTRQTSDQENHRPCVFLWYEESNTVEQVFLKINKGVVSREHLERKEEIDARIAAFVEKLNTHLSDPSLGGGLSFEENMERFKKVNGITKLVMDVVYKAMERENEY